MSTPRRPKSGRLGQKIDAGLSDESTDCEGCGRVNFDLSHPDFGEIQAVPDVVQKAPPRFRGAYLRALQGSDSPRQAIRTKCHECVGFADVRDQIQGCRARRCPLWAYRPYR